MPFADDLDVACILAFGTGISRVGLRPEADLRAFLRRNRVMAWGVTLIDLAVDLAGPFLHDLVREIAHDATLDIALPIAAETRMGSQPAAPPLLFAVPRALDEAHVSEYGGRLVDMLATANGGAELPDDVTDPLPPPSGPVARVVLREAIA